MRLLAPARWPMRPGMVQIRLPELREELLNQLPAAHGGVLMSLLDS
jgi:acyl-coenzyme A thioesterase PaaI-like protein